MGKWLTIEEKYALVVKHRRCPELSQAKLARWAMTAFNLERAPSANTVKKVLETAQEVELKHQQGITKRGRDVVSPELEAALKAFADSCTADGVRLSRKLLVQRAQQILAGLPEATRPKLGLSVGWMTNFMARHGIRFRQFRRRRAEDSEVDTGGQVQRTVSEVTDHLALARDTSGRQISDLVHVVTMPVATSASLPPPDVATQEGEARRTVLVTGAAKGIGLAFVKHYVAEGWKVVAAVRDVNKADEVGEAVCCC
jgi:hypothetical protein